MPNAVYYARHKDRLTAERMANRDAANERAAMYRAANSVAIRAYQAAYLVDPGNREANRRRSAAYYADNRDRLTARKYGLTLDQYLALSPVCEGCGDAEDLVVDHDHSCCPSNGSCGKCVRGRLCRRCNAAEGHFRGDPERARGLADYMERHRA